MGLFKRIGKAIGNIGKTVGRVATGAATGFLSTGSPWGAVVGGVAGLLGGEWWRWLLGGGGNSNIGTYIPPTSLEAYNIIKGLETQVGDISSLNYNIQKPYLDEALSEFRNFPNTLNQLFGDTENRIANRYASLFDNIQTQMNNQWNKSALGLSALGMYNTPATQLTQADIVNQLYGKIAEQKTQTLNQLDLSKMSSLIDYYNRKPQFLATLGETFANIDPTINKYNMQLQLAGVLNGLNTVLYPKISPLAQAGQMINSAILNNAQNLPSFSSVIDSIKGIFGRGSRFSFSPSTPSYGWSNALNNALPVPKLFG
jgi:hypothetical protein